MNRGALIVLEGLDRSGKSSQSKNIVKELNAQNIRAEWMCFPDRSTHIGKLIDSYLQDKTDLHDMAIHLLFSANRWELLPKIEEKLLSGTTLVIDRYSYSGVAYSFAKTESFDLEWYKGPERGLPKPDLVLFLDLNEEALAKRKGFGTERYEKVEFLNAVEGTFMLLKDDNWKVVNADMAESELTKMLLEEVLKVHNNVKNSPIPKLW